MIWLMVRKSLRQHAFSTVVTAISIALAGGLLMAVWVVQDQAQKTFTGMTAGFDAVLGARGSKLQLALNALFHLEESPGNITWQDFLEAQKNPHVELAIPLAMGDNYQGYRVVGTTSELFSQAEYAPGKRYTPKPPGRTFDITAREAVAGSLVARKLGLKVGDTIHPYHGLTFHEEKEHEEDYVIVGVLEPSNTPADRVIWIPLEGLQKMGGHDPKSTNEISAALVKVKGSNAGFLLDRHYNQQGGRLTLAWPVGRVLTQLFDKVAWFDRILQLIGYLVAVVAIGSVLASIYNSTNERRRDIAIFRALGAHRSTILAAIVSEAASIAALGMAGAFLVYASIAGIVTFILRTQIGIILNPFVAHPVLLWTPIGMILLAGLAGLIPGYKAYRTDVAENLSPIS